jgi:hypothetical protein
LLWAFTTGGTVVSSPAVANGVVYVGSGDHNLYALDASTGDLLWSYTTGWAVYSSQAVADGVVYVGSDDDKVYAFHLPCCPGYEPRWNRQTRKSLDGRDPGCRISRHIRSARHTRSAWSPVLIHTATRGSAAPQLTGKKPRCASTRQTSDRLTCVNDRRCPILARPGP